MDRERSSSRDGAKEGRPITEPTTERVPQPGRLISNSRASLDAGHAVVATGHGRSHCEGGKLRGRHSGSRRARTNPQCRQPLAGLRLMDSTGICHAKARAERDAHLVYHRAVRICRHMPGSGLGTRSWLPA